MNKAQTMFNKLGFKLYDSSERCLLYVYKTDYDEVTVRFDLENKSYSTTWSIWVDKDTEIFVPMNERPQNIKHSCRYGHWQAQMWHDINVEQHNAIHQQMIELGWIK